MLLFDDEHKKPVSFKIKVEFFIQILSFFSVFDTRHYSCHQSLSIAPENIQNRFSDVFRGCRKRPAAWNGSNGLKLLIQIFSFSFGISRYAVTRIKGSYITYSLSLD